MLPIRLRQNVTRLLGTNIPKIGLLQKHVNTNMSIQNYSHFNNTIHSQQKRRYNNDDNMVHCNLLPLLVCFGIGYYVFDYKMEQEKKNREKREMDEEIKKKKEEEINNMIKKGEENFRNLSKDEQEKSYKLMLALFDGMYDVFINGTKKEYNILPTFRTKNIIEKVNKGEITMEKAYIDLMNHGNTIDYICDESKKTPESDILAVRSNVKNVKYVRNITEDIIRECGKQIYNYDFSYKKIIIDLLKINSIMIDEKDKYRHTMAIFIPDGKDTSDIDDILPYSNELEIIKKFV